MELENSFVKLINGSWAEVTFSTQDTVIEEVNTFETNANGAILAGVPMVTG